MDIKRLLREKLAASTDKTARQLDHADNKDIFAFIIALYQLFTPLLLALLIAGAIVALVISCLFR